MAMRHMSFNNIFEPIAMRHVHERSNCTRHMSLNIKQDILTIEKSQNKIFEPIAMRYISLNELFGPIAMRHISLLTSYLDQ